MEEALAVGWELEEAEKKLERSRLSRLQVLAKKLDAPCVDGCKGQWLLMANDTLTRNGIDIQHFAESVQVLLKQSRGKYRNVCLKGLANCSKTLILDPVILTCLHQIIFYMLK